MKYLVLCVSFFFLLQNSHAVNITFRVDLSNLQLAVTPEVNGTFNGWCGNCNAMTDTDGDNIWETTIDLGPGYYEYKFSYNNWQGAENLSAGSACTNTTDIFTNRVLNVSTSAVLPIVCWNSCSACEETPITEWELCWSDEFNGNALDASIWTQEVGGWGWGNNEWQYYTNNGNNIDISNGTLKINARQESFAGSNYTSARIITNDKFEFQYGRVEARMKLPMGQGIWPAFWMLGANIETVSWPQCGEIDIMEHVNNEMQTHGTMHWNNNGHAYTGSSTPVTPADFHNYGVIWDETKALFYVDDVFFFQYEYANFSNSQPIFTKPFFLLLNVAVGGNWPGYPDGTTVFPATMEVDYVRVYKEVQPGFECGVAIPTVSLYRDADNDTYGNPNESIEDFFPQDGYVLNNTDCDDTNPNVHSGASEVCANGVDDDCDTFIDEGCQIFAATNDLLENASYINAQTYPFCSALVADLDDASPSPQAYSTAPVGAGQDVWYEFISNSQGARITSSSPSCDVVIELHDAAGNLIGMENETSNGNEILVAGNLVLGGVYHVLIRNFNPLEAGIVNTCIQSFTISGPDNGLSFNNLCSYIKCDWNGAQLYSVTFDDGQNQFTASNTSTQIPFSLLSGLQYGITYNVTFNATFLQSDASGNQSTVVVSSSPYPITIQQHPPVSLRTSDRCPTARSLGAFLGTDRIVCGATNYQWEMVACDASGISLGNDPVYYTSPGLSRYMRVSSIPGVQWGDFYQIRIRPIFANVDGMWSAESQLLCVAAPAGIDGLATERVFDGAEAMLGSTGIYPNPNTGNKVFINVDGLDTDQASIKIYDATGRVIFDQVKSIHESSVIECNFMHQLSKGVYAIEITFDDERIVEKMMVE